MTNSRKKIYIDIDGVLLTTKKKSIAEHSVEFINYVVDNFDCYWLTTHCKEDSSSAIKYLSMFFDEQILIKIASIKATNWTTLKTEGIDFSSDFYWVDDCPFNAELKTLEKNNCAEKLIVADLNNYNELKRIINMLRNTTETNASS